MSIREIAQYQISCDWPGCGYPQDPADAPTFITRDDAERDWSNNHLRPAAKNGNHYCAHHPVCETCGAECPNDPDYPDRDFQCTACAITTAAELVLAGEGTQS